MTTPLDKAADEVLELLLQSLRLPNPSSKSDFRRFAARTLVLASLEVALGDLNDPTPFARKLAENAGEENGKAWVQRSQAIKERLVGDERFDQTKIVEGLMLGLLTADIYTCAVEAATEDAASFTVEGVDGQDVVALLRAQEFVHPLTGNTQWEEAKAIYGF